LEKILYLRLNGDQFLREFDEFQIEMTINEIPSARLKRQQVFSWLKDWIQSQNSEILEKFLVFISGTTRIPLERKITVIIKYKLQFKKIILTLL